ncbi:MoaD/ThiS family protein [Flexistipes sp.]|uniref:MoaD/ThiS family protein n=1 Tax=Flexistipes sp. TaxID=3088135 RepID=UPI002E25068B|nr:MoaD/ThiS family protein [Flexistipes sp.]
MITVKAYAGLSDYLTNKTGKYTTVFDNKNRHVTVSDILEYYKIPKKEASIILINGKSCEPDSEVTDGDTLTLFSPVGGG